MKKLLILSLLFLSACSESHYNIGDCLMSDAHIVLKVTKVGKYSYQLLDVYHNDKIQLQKRLVEDYTRYTITDCPENSY